MPAVQGVIVLDLLFYQWAGGALSCSEGHATNASGHPFAATSLHLIRFLA
jgi:hypothetical protein